MAGYEITMRALRGYATYPDRIKGNVRVLVDMIVFNLPTDGHVLLKITDTAEALDKLQDWRDTNGMDTIVKRRLPFHEE